MVALFHHKTQAPPTPKACTSHALFFVVTDAGSQPVCGPHLHMMMGQLFAEHPHTAGEDPAPGTTCQYLEVSR